MIIGCFYMCLLGSAIFSVVTGDASDTTELLQSVISSFGNPLVLITGFVNFILGIIILVFLLQDSKFGPNKYGESPKYVTVDDQAAGAKAEQSDFDKGIEKVGDTIDNIAEAAQDKAEDLAGKAKESASDLVDKAKGVAEKAKDSAGDFVDKAKDAAENVADKAKDLTEKAKDAID